MSKTHTGGCQCGTVRYEASFELGKVMACNCSRCGRIGSLFSFVPASDFLLISGDDDLQDYQFNTNVIHHLFCKICGIESFARGVGPDGAEMVAINARCLDDVDVGALEITEIDGRSL